jgi:hypothetical protein
VTATLNSLGMLVQRRPIAANKILNSVLNFNPLKLGNSPLTPKNKVIMKSIERTTRALCMNIMKRYELSLTRLYHTLITCPGTLRIPSTDGYSSTWSAYIEHALTYLTSRIANVQHLPSRPMASIRQRGSELLRRLPFAHSLLPQFRLCLLVTSAGGSSTLSILKVALSTLTYKPSRTRSSC